MLARVSAWLKRHPVIAFFTLSYALTWPGWWVEAAGIPFGTFLVYFGPALAAVVTAALASGKTGLEELLARLFRWRVPVKWYLVAVLLPVGSVLGVLAIATLARSDATGFGAGRLMSLLPQLAFVLVFASVYGTVIAAGEEVG